MYIHEFICMQLHYVLDSTALKVTFFKFLFFELMLTPAVP